MHAVRRERAVNFGDTSRLEGAETKQVASITVGEGRAWTVYAIARFPDGAPPAVPMVTIRWGHGGASIEEEYPLVRRLRVPLVASMVNVSARLVDLSGQPAPSGARADVVAFIAPGTDGETLRASTWIAQTGARGQIASGPQRVLCVEGFNAGPSDRWLMVFDTDSEPEDNDVPAMVTPAPVAPARFELRRFDTQAFARGVFWAASTKPLALKKDSKAVVRVDVELLL